MARSVLRQWTIGTLTGLLLAGLGARPAAAQGLDPTINVSSSPGESRHPHLVIDAAGVLHMAWADDSANPAQHRIRYVRSFDRGQTFTAPIELSSGQASFRPRLATFGNIGVFVVWMEDPPGAQEGNTKEVMFSRSLDGGATFSAPVALSNTPGNSLEARVAMASNGTLYVVWDEEWPSRHIAIRRSSDGGTTWDAHRAVAPVVTPPGCPPDGVGNCDTVYPGVAVDPASGRVYVVWHDRVGSQPQVLFSRSLDGGETFSAPLNLSHAAIHAHCASLTVGPSGRVLVAFEARKDLVEHKHDAVFTQSIDGGASFLPPVNLSQGPSWALSDYPWAVEGPGGAIVVGWEDNRGGGHLDAVATYSTDGGQSFAPSVNLSNNAESVSTEVVTLFGPDGSFYVVWEDQQFGKAEVLFRRALG
ncbi:MAG: sialidase family protein, partial [Candidatus Rokuibacteriota bacterium]